MMAEVSKTANFLPERPFRIAEWRLSRMSSYRNSFNCQINWTVQCHLVATRALVMIGSAVGIALMLAKPAKRSI